MSQQLAEQTPPGTVAPDAPPAHSVFARARAAASSQRRDRHATFTTRHHDWSRWTRRSTAARDLATMLGLPPEHVTADDDPDRAYGINGQYPGDRLRAVDPHHDNHVWEFLPDPTADGQGWFLLGPCGCDGLVPVARVASLADLGDELEHLFDRVPAECDGDPGHRPGCSYRRHHAASAATPPPPPATRPAGAEYTVLGVWLNDEPVPVGAIGGNHDVRGDMPQDVFPEGCWATHVHADDPDHAQHVAVAAMRGNCDDSVSRDDPDDPDDRSIDGTTGLDDDLAAAECTPSVEPAFEMSRTVLDHHPAKGTQP